MSSPLDCSVGRQSWTTPSGLSLSERARSRRIVGRTRQYRPPIRHRQTLFPSITACPGTAPASSGRQALRGRPVSAGRGWFPTRARPVDQRRNDAARLPVARVEKSRPSRAWKLAAIKDGFKHIAGFRRQASPDFFFRPKQDTAAQPVRLYELFHEFHLVDAGVRKNP